MRKLLPYIILFIIAMLISDALFDPHHMTVHLGDEDVEGPFGTLFGLLIGLVVLVFVGIVLAVVFAGVSILVVAALVLAALALSPLMLPLLIPVAIIWYLASRSRSDRLKEGAA